MRKAIVMLLLAVVSSGAAAEWVKVGETSSATVYVDPATVRRDGDLVKIETLYDLKAAIVSKNNGKAYTSQKSQSAYDCKEAQWRMLSFSWYSKNMSEGKMVEYLSDTYKWEPIRPGSGVEMLWQFACGKR